MEANLNDVMIVFKYFIDKDVFEKFYAQLLARRYFQNYNQNQLNVLSIEVQKSLIQRKYYKMHVFFR